MRKHAAPLIAAAGIALFAVVAVAQTEKQAPPMTPEQKAEMEAYMKAGTPGPQHQALAAQAGEYTVKVKSWHTPGAPPTEDGGTARRSMMLDGRILLEEFASAMMGTPFNGRGMFGFDNVTGRYWSTWTDSMSTGIMLTDGACDATGKTCTFTGGWTDPVKKTPVKARMTTRWPSPTVEIFEMFGPGKDGKEMKMMEITYTKK